VIDGFDDEEIATEKNVGAARTLQPGIEGAYQTFSAAHPSGLGETGGAGHSGKAGASIKNFSKKNIFYLAFC